MHACWLTCKRVFLTYVQNNATKCNYWMTSIFLTTWKKKAISSFLQRWTWQTKYCVIFEKKNGEKNRYLLFYHVITARNPFKILAKKEFFLYIESFEFSSWYWDILIFEDISIRIKMLNFHTIVNQINPNPDIYSCVLLMVGWGLFCPHITTVTSHEPAYSKQRHLLEIIYKYN